MSKVLPNHANPLTATMVAIADGSRITTGTVYFFVTPLDGDNAGLWWDGDAAGWSEVQAAAGVGLPVGNGRWKCTVAAGAWDEGVAYLVYAEESGALNVAYEQRLLCEAADGATAGAVSGVIVIKTSAGVAVPGAEVWITTGDDSRAGVVWSGTTDAFGKVRPALDPTAGDDYYRVWAQFAEYVAADWPKGLTVDEEEGFAWQS